MRRWNGWGDEGVRVPLPPAAGPLLERLVGSATPPRDATLDGVLAAVPPSRLPTHPLVSDDPEDRLRHARGQSLPDWLALRSGRVGRVPDGVARPGSADEVRALFAYAASAGAVVVPYGGGTGVVGGLTPQDGDAPVLTVSMERLAGLRTLDETSGLATAGAGTAGPGLEAALGARGWTLGHFPQSWELSTVGGWVATRSVGQQSLGYGRIEALFAGGRVEAPAGSLKIPPHPASAAGPDLRSLVLGSEGRIGIVTDAVLRVRPKPERELVAAAMLPEWERGLAGVRELARAGLPLSMVRLMAPSETRTTLALARQPGLVRLLNCYLDLRGLGPERSLALLVATGRARDVGRGMREAIGVLGAHGAVRLPGAVGRSWMAERFRSAYLRNALWEAGYAVDTLETAADWARIPALASAVASALRTGLTDAGERVHAYTHASHVYPTGTSLYVTYLFRIAADPDETLARWRRLKDAASRAIVAGGGTISHQHGVGRDHRPYLVAEKGELGIAVLRDVGRRLDPDGLMNPGVLLPGAGEP